MSVCKMDIEVELNIEQSLDFMDNEVTILYHSENSEVILQQSNDHTFDNKSISSSEEERDVRISELIKIRDQRMLKLWINAENIFKHSDSLSGCILSDNELGSHDAINDNTSDSSDDDINSEIDVACDVYCQGWKWMS